jgi:hypothetical protein
MAGLIIVPVTDSPTWHKLLGLTRAAWVRISYVGEQAWELYVPFSYGLSLRDLLYEEGVTPIGAHRWLQFLWRSAPAAAHGEIKRGRRG